MKLEVHTDSRAVAIEVPREMLDGAEEFFQKMDRDMNAGWRMGPEWIEQPDRAQRCQIVADRLLGALSGANETMAQLMAGYILKRLPGIRAVRVDTGGDPLQTELMMEQPASIGGATPPAPAVRPAKPLTKLEAMEQAGKEVSKVYRVGRNYRFAEFDPARGQWIESPLLDNEQDAETLRQQAFKRRFEALTGNPPAA